MSAVNKHKKESSDAETESSTVPDSTTREKLAFSIGDEVLMKRKDGNFYLGTVVEVDNVREQCLIKFGDNTESWSKLKHLTKLSTGDGYDDVVMCVMCKQSNPNANNEIVVCNRCARGYHQLCHQPVISHESMRNGSFWQCRRCQVPLIEELRAYRKKAAAAAVKAAGEKPTSPNKKKLISQQKPAAAAAAQLKSSPSLQTTVSPTSPQPAIKIQLPYDLKSLVWDEHHKVNTEQKYCYCGNSGDWYLKMLQCTRCKQWFHERCVSCLQYPLYLGDRFYVFVCSVCNFGVEFARRLEIGWVDMVHLALFNMTVFRAEKYHHIDEHIVYFINCNWAYLQLPPKINKVRPKERKNIISNVLIKNSSRFKSAREVKKSCSLWGLRLRVPPPCLPAPTLPPILSPRNPLNEQRLLESDPSVKFLQLSDRPVVNLQKTDVTNHHQNCQNGGVGSVADTVWDTVVGHSLSPIPVPKSWNKPLFGIKLLHIDTRPLLLPKGMPATGHKVCIKSSVPCFPESRSQIEKRIRAQKAENKKMKDLLARKARKLLKDAIATSQKISQDLPLTPPSSVSAPDTPHLSSSSSNNTSPPPPAVGDASSVVATATTTPCVSLVSSDEDEEEEEDDDCDNDDDDDADDDDDDDDTTSHGTLDSIIPPPKDFQGKNNPFVRSVSELLGGGVEAESPPLEESPSDLATPPAITLPITLTPVITLRPTKRRLSEKDIRINRNGEVKRRRLRRQCNAKNKKELMNGRYGGGDVATVYNKSTSKVVNGKRLRSSSSKTSLSNVTTSQPPVTSSSVTSPVKSGGGVAISLNDIKNSVNHYFGAANRIARGERFTVRAKRVLATTEGGRTEYLIEWHAPAT